MTAFIRNLTFHSNNLGISATLVLTFDSQSMEGIYSDYFPTAWRVSTFGEKGPYSMFATYQNQLAFIKPQVSGGVVVAASTWANINVGQKTNLTESNGVFSLSPPEPGLNGYLQAWNKTTSNQGIGLGFNNDPSRPPNTVLYFPSVGSTYNVTAQFTPVLKAYVIANYQQNQIIRAAVETPAIWQKDLAALDTNSSFTLSYNAASGIYSITQDLAAFTLTREPQGSGTSDKDYARIVKLLKELLGDGGVKKFLQNGTAPSEIFSEITEA